MKQPIFLIRFGYQIVLNIFINEEYKCIGTLASIGFDEIVITSGKISHKPTLNFHALVDSFFIVDYTVKL